MYRLSWSLELCATIGALLLLGCGSGSSSSETGGSAGLGGSASLAGAAGSNGVGGTAVGSAGAGGAAGTSGTSAGASAGDSAETAGSSGAAGAAGAGGNGGTAGSAGSGGNGNEDLPFALTSPAFDHHPTCVNINLGACDVIPVENLLDTFMVDGVYGSNISPELNWGPGPKGTMSYAIGLHDYTKGATQWVIWNIPASTLHLPKNLPRDENPATPAGARQVSSDNDSNGYQGPDASNHLLEFRLYALKTATFTPANPDIPIKVRGELETSANGAVLAVSDLRGKSP